MRTLLAWRRSHPWLASLAGLLAVFVLVHFFLYWRAERRWRQYCNGARTRGVKLTLPEFKRPEIPDVENFAELPMLRAAFSGNFPSPFALPWGWRQEPSFGGGPRADPVDWNAWQRSFQEAGLIAEVSEDPIRDTLRALDHYAPQFQEWSAWRTRPHSRLPLDLNAVSNELRLTIFWDAAHLFALRMRAHLVLRDSASALVDFQEGFQAYRALQGEPTLSAGGYRRIVVRPLLEAVGEGLRARAWAPEDLVKIEAELATVHVWEDFTLAFASQRGAVNARFELMANATGAERWRLSWGFDAPAPSGPEAGIETILHLMPKWVLRDNQLHANRHLDEVLARADLKASTFDPFRDSRPSPLSIIDKANIYYHFLSWGTTPYSRSLERSYILLQTRLDHIRLACALERFRQSRGAFPAALEELMPEFIERFPVDTYSHALYHYRRKAPGSFLLYSVGSNGIDDGGVVNEREQEPCMGAYPKPAADDIWLFAPTE